MSYRDWRPAFDRHFGTSEPARSAQVWNLEHDKRIAARVSLFKRRIGKLYADLVADGARGASAVAQALDAAIKETRDAGNRWLGHIPLAGSSAPPSRVVTYRSGFKFRKRYKHEIYASKGNPKRAFQISEPLDSEKDSSGVRRASKRFHWITFSHGGNNPPGDDPTKIKRELGLAHFQERETIYRFELTIADGQDVWIPTCLDAGLYEAWMPPPRNAPDPWGRSRDLVDGQPRWPELLVHVKDYLSATPLVAKLVSPPGKIERIGPVKPDYMTGR